MAASISEAALEAWSECKPEGMKLAAERLKSLLPEISVRVPGALTSADKARKLNEIFQPRGDADALFFEWLQPVDGVVHFLYFWRAFVDASHFVGGASASVSDRLAAEVDALRDDVLLCDDGGAVPAASLVAAVHAAAAGSKFPRFWPRCVDTVATLQECGQFSLPELAMIMLPWAQAAALETAEAGPVEWPVRVHIYDVSQDEGVRKLNSILAHERNPLKFGGVFHAGVEVMDLEWSYGATDCESLPGVSCAEPRTHPMHHYRQTVELGMTNLSSGDIGSIISSMLEEYPGHEYDLLRKNCCHFADDFCRRLKVGGIPGWVHRLARVGASLETALHRARGIPGMEHTVQRLTDALLPEDVEDLDHVVEWSTMPAEDELT